MTTVQYRHTQIGYLLIAVLGGALIGMGALAGATGWPIVSLLVVAVLALCLFTFSTLTVIITDTALEFHFSARLLGRRLNLDAIHSERIVRNPWYYGWGIHATPEGWVYNVSGVKAVEVTLRDGRRYRIGTDEPDEMVARLRAAMQRLPR